MEESPRWLSEKFQQSEGLWRAMSIHRKHDAKQNLERRKT
jgi:hypothetical protein